MKNFVWSVLTILTTTLAMAHMAEAAEPKLIGSFDSWKAYSFEEPTGKVCFMSSTPQKAEGKYTQRGDIFAMITHRPGEKSKNVFSYITGYTFKDSSEVTIMIDGERFVLFTKGENAWTSSDDMDNKLATAIQKGSKMVVKGISARGTKTTDTFSLKGTGNAYSAISKECGI